jgi:hypothetical protein
MNTLICLFVAVGLPVWSFVLAVLVLIAMPWIAQAIQRINRTKGRFALKVFRKAGHRLPMWASLWLLDFGHLSVSGGLPGTVVGITMNAGYAGQYSRNGDNITEAKEVTSGTYTGNINFGDVVVLIPDSTGGTWAQGAAFIAGGGTFQMGGSGNTTSSFAGFAVREIKQQLTISTFGGAPSANNQLGYYAAGNPCDVLVRGTVMAGNYYAKSGNTAPVANGPVYYRVSTNGAGTFVGAL